MFQSRMTNKIIIFDMDGCLVDSQPAHAAAFNLAFKKNNLKTFPTDEIISTFGPPAEDNIKSEGYQSYLKTIIRNRKIIDLLKKESIK